MALKYKGLVIILDGLGDRPSPQLGGLTPLESAATVNMNRLAAEGVTGLVDPLFPGIPVGTHTGTGVLLGLPLSTALNLQRGPVEAAGIGMHTEPGDILIRCNLATVEPRGEGLAILDRRAGRISERTEELTATLRNLDLGEGVRADLRPGTQHRAVLRLYGTELSAAITDTDSAKNYETDGVLQCLPRNHENSAACRTAAAVNRFVKLAFGHLQDHAVNRDRISRGMVPANGVITRGAGLMPHIESIVNHVGIRAALITGESTVAGAARLLGYTIISDAAFTALANTDLGKKFATAQQALTDHDLVFVHIKGTDICSHDFDPLAKKALLERIDAELTPLLEQDLLIAVSGDHSTDSNTGRHCGDPVPSFIHAPNSRRSGVNRFGESECVAGGLGRLNAASFVVSILDNMGALQNYRPEDQRFLS